MPVRQSGDPEALMQQHRRPRLEVTSLVEGDSQAVGGLEAGHGFSVLGVQSLA